MPPVPDHTERVAGWLRTAFGDAVHADPDQGIFIVPGGTEGIFVRVAPVGEGHVVLDVYTFVARGLEVSDALALQLMRRNAEIRFGKMALDPDGDIVLEGSLFTEQLSEELLRRMLDLIGGTAQVLAAELPSA